MKRARQLNSYHHQLGEVIDLADAFPNTTIVLDHVGGVIGVGDDRAQRDDVLACWENDIRDLASRDNVSMVAGRGGAESTRGMPGTYTPGLIRVGES